MTCTLLATDCVLLCLVIPYKGTYNTLTDALIDVLSQISVIIIFAHFKKETDLESDFNCRKTRYFIRENVEI